MIASILTESTINATLISLILGEDARDVEVRAVGPSSSVYSVARNLLLARRMPVAVVIDAHSSEPEIISERRQTAEEVIGEVASTPFRLLIAVPQLTALFFQRPDALRRLFGDKVTEQWIELSGYSARSALRKLDPDADYADLCLTVMQAMDLSDYAALRQTEIFRGLIGFLELARRSFRAVAVPS